MVLCMAQYVKLPPATPAPHIRVPVEVLTAKLPNQLFATVPEKAANNDPKT